MRQKVNDSTEVRLAGACLCWQLSRVHEQLSQLPGVTMPLSDISVGQIAWSESKRMVRIYSFLNDCLEEALAVWMDACVNQVVSLNGDSTHGMPSSGDGSPGQNGQNILV